MISSPRIITMTTRILDTKSNSFLGVKMENNEDRMQPSRSYVKKKAIITLVIGCVLTSDGLMALLSLLLLPSLAQIYESMNIAFDVDASKAMSIVRGVICLTAGISLLIVSLLSYRKMKTMPADPILEPKNQEGSDGAEAKPEPIQTEDVKPTVENSPQTDFSSRLKELDQLHQDDLVSDSEYISRRTEILRDAGY